MKKLILNLLCVLISICSTSAEVLEHVKIGVLYYALDTDRKIAVVTYELMNQDNNYLSVCRAYIPHTILYNSENYKVIGIANWAFCRCKSLTSVTIPNSVTFIGSFAFSDCRNLPFIDIPNSVTTIGEDAFSSCVMLTSIEIPNSVTEIYDRAFSRVPNIIYSGSAEGAPWGAKSINGFVDGNFVYADNTKTTLLACNAAVNGEVRIPNSVKYIGDYAFAQCRYVTSIIIPDETISIGNGAFVTCEKLKFISIPQSVRNIGKMAFMGCENLKSIKIPQNVMHVGLFAFDGCKNLQEIYYPKHLDLSKTYIPKTSKVIPYD